MTQLSNEALGFTTDDYEMRLTELPDMAEGSKRTVYGVYNRKTGVREGFTESLWLALVSLKVQQDRLSQAVDAVKNGKVNIQDAGFDGLPPPRMN